MLENDELHLCVDCGDIIYSIYTMDDDELCADCYTNRLEVLDECLEESDE